MADENNPGQAPAPQENFSLDGGADPGMAEIERIMTHDPFAPKEGDAKPTAGPSVPAPTTENQPPAPTAPVAPPGAPPATQAPQPQAQPASTPQADPLAPVVAQLSDIANRMGQQQQQQPAGDDLPDYEIDVPDQLVAALGSENPAERKVATAHLVKGVGRLIHKTVREDFAKAIPAIINHYIRQYDTQRQIFDDFYGTHKDLNKPELRQEIATALGLMMQQGRHQGWNPALRDAVAQHVRTLRGMPTPGSPPPAPAAAAPAPQAPHVFTPGTRPGTPQSGSQQQEMLDLIFG